MTIQTAVFQLEVYRNQEYNKPVETIDIEVETDDYARDPCNAWDTLIDYATGKAIRLAKEKHCEVGVVDREDLLFIVDLYGRVFWV